ncbi:mechanosensitive ion channel family protein [Candidatus Woesearchaeota archaeon]|nr:mechanosensitive ion channel family protein [Candidatus Woesearchaeota archaeon]MBW3005422.1 mechanosensitive ion channel family protein [Candidatus Woesearchaeota archaeon]
MKKEGSWLFIYIFLFIVLLILRIAGPSQAFFNWTQIHAHIFHSALAILLALSLSEIAGIYLKHASLIRIAHYILFFGTCIAIIFIFQDKLLSASISLGIAAAALAFIFQSPVLNLMGWIYLTMGQIYKEGDRIRINDLKGDILDVNPLRTKVREVGGEYVNADLPSGRLITFPNSLLLTTPISNYSKYFPYIWVDAAFQLTYDTDFGFVMKNIQDIVAKNLKKYKKDMEQRYTVMLHFFDVKKEEFSMINFNLNAVNSWIELRVTYPVNPKEQSGITTKVNTDIINFLKKHPKKAAFPKGTAR